MEFDMNDLESSGISAIKTEPQETLDQVQVIQNGFGGSEARNEPAITLDAVLKFLQQHNHKVRCWPSHHRLSLNNFAISFAGSLRAIKT